MEGKSSSALKVTVRIIAFVIAAAAVAAGIMLLPHLGKTELPVQLTTAVTTAGEADTLPPEKAPAPEWEGGASTPLCWKVTSENGGVLWLLGSMHTLKDDAYPLPEKLLGAYESSGALMVECDILAAQNDLPLIMKCMRMLIYTDGTKIYDHLSAGVYEAAKSYLSAGGLYMSVYDSYKPALWASLIEADIMQKSGFDEAEGLDMYFLGLASAGGKKIIEAESVTEQYEMLSSFPDGIQELLLSSLTREDYAEYAAQESEKLYSVWKNGDYGEACDYILTIDTEGLTDEETELYEQYNRTMITDRNAKMALCCGEYLDKGESVFALFGLAHMLGDSGVPALLEKAGYEVTEVIYTVNDTALPVTDAADMEESA